MKEKLFEFYKNKASVESLVFAQMRTQNIFLSLTLWTSAFMSIVTFCMFPFYETIKMYFFLALALTVLSIVGLILSVKKFKQKAKIIVQKKLNKKIKGKRWRTEEFNEYQREMIRGHLRQHNMLVKWKIEKLLESYNSEVDKKKLPPLVAPTIIIALLAPNLAQILTFFYKKYAGQELYIFVTALIITLSIIYTVARIKRMIEEIKEDLSKGITFRKELISILEDILLGLEEEVTA